MWNIKYFKTYEQAKKFMLRNNYKNRYRYELIFVEMVLLLNIKNSKQCLDHYKQNKHRKTIKLS